MIKRIKTKEIVSALKKGVDIFYFDRKTNKFIKLEDAIKLLPGVFVVEDKPLFGKKKTRVETVPKDEGSHRRKNIDKNKVKELHEAGWKPKDIAEKMGVSLQAIYYHLKQMQNEVQE